MHFNSLNLLAFSLQNYTNWWLIYKVWLIYWAVSWACGAGWQCQCRFEIIIPPQDLLCSCFTLSTCYCTLQNKATKKKSCFELVCVCFGICTVIYLWFVAAFDVTWSDICSYINLLTCTCLVVLIQFILKKWLYVPTKDLVTQRFIQELLFLLPPLTQTFFILLRQHVNFCIMLTMYKWCLLS